MGLVLTLEDGEFIFIGPDITLAIHKKKSVNGHLRVSIEAPRDIQIQTSRYLKKKQKELMK